MDAVTVDLVKLFTRRVDLEAALMFSADGTLLSCVPAGPPSFLVHLHSKSRDPLGSQIKNYNYHVPPHVKNYKDHWTVCYRVTWCPQKRLLARLP